ncbi:hypothetical protein F383_19546 [Gossypium arboreum]|uniref:Uncharacterized protein n=1 Tax=Gossypium arboreum TaxID=29729 RepID=A0A0B0NN50_GOSAR|nr:hypothetical protein F383_19546 [Gossypium arboreum]
MIKLVNFIILDQEIQNPNLDREKTKLVD